METLTPEVGYSEVLLQTFFHWKTLLTVYMLIPYYWSHTFISFATNVFPEPGGPRNNITSRAGRVARPGGHSKSSTNTARTWLSDGGTGDANVGGGGASGGAGKSAWLLKWLIVLNEDNYNNFNYYNNAVTYSDCKKA
jgi:hypothetical protein